MAHKLIALLAVACLVSLSSTYSPLFSFDGWDAIILDYPSYLFTIQHSYTAGQVYVFGGTSLRIVNTGNNFSVQDNYASDWNQPFVSLHVFHNGTDLWAVGPTNPSDYTASPTGYDLPIALGGPEWHTQQVPGLQGFILYNVYVDGRNLNDVLSYMVGFMPLTGQGNETVNQVALGIVRLHVNLNLPYSDREFNFNYAQDTVSLSLNQFCLYGSHFKPHIHFSNTSNLLIVVEPANSVVYTVQTGPGTTPMTRAQPKQIKLPGLSITSSLFHPDTNLLYVGYEAQGLGNGSVVAYDVGTLTMQHSITFNGSLANPRALAIDEPTDTIYVGFNGGDAVVKLDYLLNIQGYQRVPEYLTKIEGAQVGEEHVYFITNEQHSKVARVNKKNFCTSVCPYYGYCDNGKCKCDPLLVMSSDGQRCEIPKGTTDKGAAVALGVLFALTFIVAVLGWVLYWRQRKGGYVNV